MISELEQIESLLPTREHAWAEAVRIAPRLAVADNLRRHFGTDSVIDPQQQWIRAEAAPRGDVPSIGIEIELWWSHILPTPLDEILQKDLWRDMPEAQKVAFNAVADPIGYPLQDKCRETVALGVPHRGDDGLWEFSHAPAWHFQTLACEVDVLAAAGLVPEAKDLPLHITLGGVEADDCAHILLRALEIADGTTAARLLAPLSGREGWSRRGTAGVNGRHGYRLELGQQTGVELRTLVYKNPEQLQRLLKHAQLGGALIKQLQQPELTSVSFVHAWQEFQSRLEQITGLSAGAFVDWPAHSIDAGPWIAHAERLQSPEVMAAVGASLDEMADYAQRLV